jgi:hypothetical protein
LPFESQQELCVFIYLIFFMFFNLWLLQVLLHKRARKSIILCLTVSFNP